MGRGLPAVWQRFSKIANLYEFWNKNTAVSTKVVPQKRKGVRDNDYWYYG